MEKTAKIIRYITAAPIIACITMIILFIARPDIFGGALGFILSLVFLTVLPLLAYPLQRYIPSYKDKGRDGQRSLAMVFAVGGYVLGCISCALISASAGLWMIYLEYLFSGIFIFVFNKLFHLKASGHACGVAGPIAFLVYMRLPAVIPGVIVLALTCWASIKTKRHTIWQFLGGCVIPVAILLVLWACFGTV